MSWGGVQKGVKKGEMGLVVAQSVDMDMDYRGNVDAGWEMWSYGARWEIRWDGGGGTGREEEIRWDGGTELGWWYRSAGWWWYRAR